MKAYDWLHEIKMSKQWDFFVAARSLCSDKVWERYETFGIEGLREQQILDRARKALLSLWKTKRPKIFGTPKR